MTIESSDAMAAVFQILTITKEDLEIDTLMVSGTGGIDLMGEWMEIDGADTTTCIVDLDYVITAADLKVGSDSENDDCPEIGWLRRRLTTARLLRQLSTAPVSGRGPMTASSAV